MDNPDALIAQIDARHILEASAFEGGFVALPDGYSVHALEDLQSAPNRIKAARSFRETKSLAAYLDRFQQTASIALSDADAFTITALIDYHDHANGFASHVDHTAMFKARMTSRYQAWSKVHGKAMGQVEAGMFLEERAVDVVDPDAATIMEVVMQFDALKRVTFKQSTRLQDGTRQFTYAEENEVRGNVTLPERISIRMPVFEGQDPDVIPVRLKYSINDGKLQFKFEIHEKAEVEATAFERCEDALLTDLKTPILLLRQG